MPADTRLMLTGAFGYDLLLQFDPIGSNACRATIKRHSTFFFATTSTSWIARKK
jgi:hypothetical protein